MFDFPRPEHSMSAHMQRFALLGAFAGAAMLPLSVSAATVHHAAPAHRAPAHGAVAVKLTHASAHPVDRSRPGRKAARAASPLHSATSRLPQAETRTGKHGRAVVAVTSRKRTAPAESVAFQAARGQRPVPPKPVAQQTVEDRVHAWYQSQHPQDVEINDAEEISARTPPVQTPIKSAAVQTSPAAPIVRVSPSALQADEALHAAAAQQPSFTSNDDSVAIAEESHIPSTAPTQRVASPFTHGDFSLPVSSASATAPVLRASSPAASALLASTPDVKTAPVEAAVQQNTIAVTSGITPAPARLTPADEDAANAASLVKVHLYDSAGKLIVIPPMKGTHEILVHQNQMAQADGLQRISNDGQLAGMRRSHVLVSLPETAGIGVDERLPANRRYARPWTVRFLTDLSRAHYARFKTPLIVTSAVRTVSFQRHLVLVNGNAAPPTGDIASPHLYGQAVDIAKHSMTITELAWMRAYLTPVEAEGKIDVEEEFQQACFHISVYRGYLGTVGKQDTAPTQELPHAYTVQQAKSTPAKRRRLPTALLAAGLR